MKSKRIISFIVMIIMIFSFASCSYGVESVEDAISDGDTFLNTANTQRNLIDSTKLQNLSDSVYNMILLIGMIGAVIVGSILGIKFMISSVDEKAEVKKHLVIYVIGCCVLFGAFTIWKIIVSVLGSA